MPSPQSVYDSLPPEVKEAVNYSIYSDMSARAADHHDKNLELILSEADRGTFNVVGPIITQSVEAQVEAQRELKASGPELQRALAQYQSWHKTYPNDRPQHFTEATNNIIRMGQDATRGR